MINFHYSHDAVNYRRQKHDLQEKRGKMTSNFILPPSSCPRPTMTLKHVVYNIRE